MKRDCRCDLCRAGVPQDSATIMAYLRSRGLRTEPPRHGREIAAHVRRHVAPYELALAPQSKDDPPLDVLIVPPSKARPFKLLVTAGMSNLPMRPPPGSGIDLAWAELAICLPPDWRLTRRALQSDRLFWPVKLLIEIVRYSHVARTWIWFHQTYGYGPPHALGEGVRFESVFFGSTVLLPEEFLRLDVGGGKQIHFLSLYPLYPEEFEHCSKNGAHSLIDRLEANGVTDLVDPRRASVCPVEPRA